MRIKNKNVGSIVFIVVVLGFFVYGAFITFGGKTNNNSEIWVLAKHEVESNLKSPSSAKFPSMRSDEVRITEVGGKYIVKSYVDAENSFGASIRSNFTVTINKNSSGKYFVESIFID